MGRLSLFREWIEAVSLSRSIAPTEVRSGEPPFGVGERCDGSADFGMTPESIAAGYFELG